MADRVPARLTPRAGRRFGLQVGAAFLLLAAVARWRGHPASAAVLLALGALLVLGGLAAPGRLGPVYRAWMGLALGLSKVTTPILLGAVYFLVLTPTGMLLRAVGHRPLTARRRAASAWIARPGPSRPAAMEHQF